MPPVLELKGVSREYRGRAALQDFDLTVAAGRAVVLLGDNGAGKSTALKIAAGEAAPTRGTARLGGEDPRRFAVRRRTGYLSETDGVEPYLTVDESVRYLLDLYGVRREKLPAAAATLERFGLGGLGKKRAITLSKGQRRRLELARIRLVDPAMWILDEPDSGLDPAGLVLLREEIRAACDRGRAVLFSSHALADVAAADDVVVLRGGRVAFSGARDDLSARIGAHAFVLRGDAADVARLRAVASAAGFDLAGPEPPLAELAAFLYGGTSERP
jgi:ABC-type multidrug transport system ATPase subunit